MKNDLVVDRESCTGCGMCMSICKRNCISLVKDDSAAIYPHIDAQKCVSCSECVKVCPSNSIKPEMLSLPRKVYVGWNTDNDIRKNAASGGVASAFYQCAFDNGWLATGTRFTDEHILRMELFDKDGFTPAYRNSKYVFCETAEVYPQVIAKLKEGREVLFIGLPCHTAAVRALAEREKCSEKLITCDIICHGVAPAEHLLQHIDSVAGDHRSVDEISFRDPDWGTWSFMFTLRKKGKVIYKKRVKSGDAYQNGYHSALIYRENCYRCRYARPERVADITIGDFSGLGSIKPYTGERYNVSCIMVNTDKGEQLLKSASKYLVYEERPADEALKVEKQLQRPSERTEAHDVFAREYAEGRDFDRAVNTAIGRQLFSGKMYELFHIHEVKQLLRSVRRLVIKK